MNTASFLVQHHMLMSQERNWTDKSTSWDEGKLIVKRKV